MLINYLTEESKKIYLHRFAKYITPYRNVANLSSWGQILRPILKSCCTTVKIHPWWNALETGQSNYAKPTNRWTVNCFPSVLFPFAVSGAQKHNIAEKRNQWNQDKFAYFQFAALGAGCGELFGAQQGEWSLSKMMEETSAPLQFDEVGFKKKESGKFISKPIIIVVIVVIAILLILVIVLGAVLGSERAKRRTEDAEGTSCRFLNSSRINFNSLTAVYSYPDLR